VFWSGLSGELAVTRAATRAWRVQCCCFGLTDAILIGVALKERTFVEQLTPDSSDSFEEHSERQR